MTEMTSTEYWVEVKSCARTLIEETFEWMDDKSEMTRDEIREAVMDDINDSKLHELVDGHQWVIYNAYNLDIIQHSNNPDYMTDNFGNDQAGHILSSDGLDSLHTAIAFWAFYADISEELWEIHEDVLDELMPEADYA